MLGLKQWTFEELESTNEDLYPGVKIVGATYLLGFWQKLRNKSKPDKILIADADTGDYLYDVSQWEFMLKMFWNNYEMTFGWQP